MGEECKDCIQVKNLEDKISSIWHVLNELKAVDKDHEKRMTDLEITKGENRKDFDRIFHDIEEIKNSLSKIALAIENMQIKPAKAYENLKYEAIKYIVVFIIAFAIAKLIK